LLAEVNKDFDLNLENNLVNSDNQDFDLLLRKHNIFDQKTCVVNIFMTNERLGQIKWFSKTCSQILGV